ncbi:MAG TPA: RNA 2',3'-cyclic phosphodiesterase [Candidatus Hydrogenedentes bacterium]|nr:RNA 2',3'-cyclic phosphodiesterase [Candidatus Hydrogenedentota bacterium]
MNRDTARDRGPDGIRCFWAIELPHHARAALEQTRSMARSQGIRAGWTSPATYHLTLCFMGRAAPGAVRVMTERVETAVAVSRPVILRLATRGVGAFPGMARPAVCWAGVDVLSGDLSALRSLVFEAAREAGCGPDGKAFHPHVTLARSRSPEESRNLARWLGEAGHPVFGEPFQVERLVLFQSELRPEGARHTPLAEVSLL